MSTRGGEHMGLGFFIAQTLLERGGATLEFRNRNGAEVVIRWSRERFDAAMEHRTIGDMPMDR
jgi:two-component system sensor histidine kinase RegB